MYMYNTCFQSFVYYCNQHFLIDDQKHLKTYTHMLEYTITIIATPPLTLSLS